MCKMNDLWRILIYNFKSSFKWTFTFWLKLFVLIPCRMYFKVSLLFVYRNRKIPNFKIRCENRSTVSVDHGNWLNKRWSYRDCTERWRRMATWSWSLGSCWWRTVLYRWIQFYQRTRSCQWVPRTILRSFSFVRQADIKRVLYSIHVKSHNLLQGCCLNNGWTTLLSCVVGPTILFGIVL